MLRARRIGSIAVVAALGLLALSGCRSDPSVAAYVGSTELADAQVARLVDEYLRTVPQEERAGINPDRLAGQIVQFMVLDEVIGGYAKKKRLTVPEPDVKAVAQQNRLPEDSELAQVVAQWDAGMGALRKSVKPKAPTAADQREAYDHTLVQDQQTGQNRPLNQQESFEAVQQAFTQEVLGQALGVRDALVEAIADADVSVNPRYDPTYRLQVPIGNAALSWFAVQLGDSAPVRNDPAGPALLQPASGQG